MYNKTFVLLFTLFLLGGFLVLRNQALAQEQQSPGPSDTPSTQTRPLSPTELEPIVVTATRSNTSLAEVPAAVSVIDRSDIQLGLPTVGFEEPLSRIPGVFAQNSANFAQDFRLSIRGFGTRTAFGVREVKVLVDGIPETSPDGKPSLIISISGRPNGSRFCAGPRLRCTVMRPGASSTSLPRTVQPHRFLRRA